MRFAPLLILPLAAACTTVPAPSPQPGAAVPPAVRPPAAVPPTQPVRPPAVGFRVPQIQRVPGLTGVIEQDGAALVRQFGEPRLDSREGDMRKLQFAGEACVLDVFLYPMRPGEEPVAAYIETRRASDGQEVDRTACAEALRRRR
jgi:hypothetical protein